MYNLLKVINDILHLKEIKISVSCTYKLAPVLTKFLCRLLVEKYIRDYTHKFGNYVLNSLALLILDLFQNLSSIALNCLIIVAGCVRWHPPHGEIPPGQGGLYHDPGLPNQVRRSRSSRPGS